MATLLYCWKCKTEKHMLDISEWEKMEPLLNQMTSDIKEYRETRAALIAEAKSQA